MIQPLIVFPSSSSSKTKAGVRSVRAAEQCFHMQPVAASVKQNQLAAAFDVSEFVGSRVWSQIEDGLAHESAAIGAK